MYRSSILVNATLWNVLPVAGTSTLVWEERDVSSRRVVFAAWDSETERYIWTNNSLPETWWLTLAGISANHVWLKQFESTDNPDKTKWVVLSLRDGKPEENTSMADKEVYTNQHVLPFMYLADEADFKIVYNFLMHAIGVSALLGVEYCEYEQHVFISFYAGDPARFSNWVACFTSKGDLVWKEEIGINLKGIGTNTFFLLAQRIFFVKNSTELVTYRIV